MKSLNRNLLLIFLLIVNLVSAQIPCSTGFNANGIDDFITIGNTDAINLQNTRNRTIEFWFKPSDITTRQVLYEEGAQVNAILFFIEGGQIYAGGFRDNAGTNANRRFFRSSVGDIAVDEWNHIALTLEDTASPDLTFKWFLNGVEKDVQDGVQISSHSGNISIGRNGGNMRFPSSLITNWTTSSVGSSTSETYNSGFTGQIASSYNYNGNISLLRIWNVARSETQINANKSTYLTSGTSLVAYQDGDKIKYKGNGSTSIGATATANGSGTTYTWVGGNSTDFSNDANWSGTSPVVTKTQTVVINDGTNSPSITSSIGVVNIGNLTIESGAEITVESGGTLNVYYSLINNGTITVENGGSLIYHACNSSIQGSGTFKIKRVTPTYSDNKFYSYWSSPVISSDSNIATVFPDASLIYKFDAASSNSDWVSAGTSDFNAGIGYAVRNESAGGQLRTFSGKINEGDIEVDIYNTSNLAGSDFDGIVWSTEGDNLIGNPYSSAIDWDLVVSDLDNNEIDGTMYLWSQNSVHIGENRQADYLEYNMTGGANNTTTSNIGSGQGFFIKTTSANPNLKITFKTTHQVAGLNTKFLKSSTNNDGNVKKKGRSWFTFNHNDITKTILIGFLEGATESFDRLYDAPFDVEKKSMGFYSFVEDVHKATIQGLPVLKEDTKIIRVGFVADKIGDYSIGIQEEQIEEGYNIYLVDTEKGMTVDLKQAEYDFIIDAVGENNTRFKVVYSKGKLKTLSNESIEIEAKELSVYLDAGKELIVIYNNSKDDIDEVSLFNVQGRKVASYKGSQQKNTSNLSPGFYVVKVKLEDSSTLNKKILIAN
ncbi:T9SS type A sorting domain-containing protein [Polaribacter undariae]|uniref:T9SS type A sorting domain-containing protein n=1 Tax=Polaribacter sejongensis TaxID=985043 RepID=A0AAJ1QUL6_9FLAO|nr:LamG-like jellyroll fold domain-containing protein [Polaribacter undariae]MDN3618486.1 T9SS type A sorting domain-containing protein [Polaribacter undariae]UWD30532.1 T9SS type A sorting domain-containing protein [Polaribacter undariae]